MLGYEPRKLTAQDCTVLCNLAGMVVKQMQRDQLLLEKETSGQLLQRRNSRLNVRQPLRRICTSSSLSFMLFKRASLVVRLLSSTCNDTCMELLSVGDFAFWGACVMFARHISTGCVGYGYRI